MTDNHLTQQALNKAMKEAVDFVRTAGWDAPPTLFALVPTVLLFDALPSAATSDNAPLTLVVQDSLPANLPAGSEELMDYVSHLAWPEEVAGVILAQEITFRDLHSPAESAHPARLFSGVLRGGEELTLLESRPPQGEDNELRGGDNIAPGVIAALRSTLE